MHSYFPSAVLIATLACGVRAQETVNGTWEGETRSQASIALSLQAKGPILTGTLVRAGQSATLADGTVSENKFTFKATVNGQTEGFSGQLTGDEIRIWLDRQGGSSAIVLRRVTRK